MNLRSDRRQHPVLKHVYADIFGCIYQESKPLTVYMIGACRMVRVAPSVLCPAAKIGLIAVGRLSLECWVGLGGDRKLFRFPAPEGKWPDADAPENMYWSEPAATDDIGVYPGTYNWERYYWYPTPVHANACVLPDGRPSPTHRETGEPLLWKRGKAYRQFCLRDEYRKISHPQLTEVNQAPMLEVP